MVFWINFAKGERKKSGIMRQYAAMENKMSIFEFKDDRYEPRFPDNFASLLREKTKEELPEDEKEDRNQEK